MRSLMQQLIQHNLRVIEKYYSRIRLQRLAELVGVSLARAEQEICDMVGFVCNKLATGSFFYGHARRHTGQT